MPTRWRQAKHGSELQSFRKSLLLPGIADVRSSIVEDLCEYYRCSAQECVERCVNWERWSVEEWHAKDRTAARDIADFYRVTKSWSFDLSWYAYLQAEGWLYPVSVVIARDFIARHSGRRHLDFGAGIGATSQFFMRMGFESEMADISTALMEFAQFRLARRGVQIRAIDLNTESLPEDTYDIITAIDTLAHVADPGATVAALHRALRPGGILYANIDARPEAPENAWHLYTDDRAFRYQLQRQGFEPIADLDTFSKAYLRVNPGTSIHRLRGFRDLLLLRNPARAWYRRLRYRSIS